jgi:hypothetical protein
MVAIIAEAFGRDPATVFIQGYTLSRRRLLSSLRARALASMLQADIGLLPNGEPNNAPESQVRAFAVVVMLV